MKYVGIIYLICLIPTAVACISWPEASREVYEFKLGKLLFFISAWIASPFILLTMLLKKITNR